MCLAQVHNTVTLVKLEPATPLSQVKPSTTEGELRLSRNHTVTEYEMSGKPYSQKSGLKNHTNERIFQVMTRFDQFVTR